MPLLDHFHPPLDQRFHWESFHSNWATRLADAISPLLPPEYQVEEHCHAGPSLDIDIATYAEREATAPRTSENGSTKTLAAWAPPAPHHVMPAVFPDSFEIRVFTTMGGLTLVAAIELVSPGNKDRAETRRAFAAKCASFLHQGISLIVIDIVTSRKANLHNETVRLMELDRKFELSEDDRLYAVAYRPVEREGQGVVDVWPTPLGLGEALPTMPLRLTGDLFIPVDFEGAYEEACSRRGMR